MYRINELLQSDRKLFHTNDLAILWGISNRQTLYMTISRYIDSGVLFPVYKSLYATIPVDTLDPLELGVAIIHRYAYLSTETVLSQAGVLSQVVYDYTFISDQSRRVTMGTWSFRYRQMKDEYLFNPVGIVRQKQVFVASLERAAADLLYYAPDYHFDVTAHIDFEQVRSIQKQVGYG
ncbi:MAG: hypothetical protein R6V73_11800 [Anaerolineales bacterium]